MKLSPFGQLNVEMTNGTLKIQIILDRTEQIYKTWHGNPPKVSFHALMLFKGFKQRSKLVIDDSSIANYDVQKLIKNNIGVTNAIASNEMKPRCSVLANSWMRSKHASNYFLGTKKNLHSR